VNTKQIILTGVALGFTIPSMIAIGTLALTVKKSALTKDPSLEQSHYKINSGLAGCSCPFCQKVNQETGKSS
jgi:hypothetical protein